MNSRNDYFRMILVAFFGLLLVSCQLGISMVEGTKWLDSKNDRPEINIAGAWAAEDWGAATFRQEGKDITGVLGDYPVKGVVSGTSVYLLMYNKDRAEYFAELKASDDKTLKGFYTKLTALDQIKADPNYTKPMSMIFSSPLK